MDHKKYIVPTVTLFLAAVMLVACSTPQATPSPTNVVQACPTAPACPNPTSVQAPVAKGQWFSVIEKASGIKVIIDPGDKCTVETNPGLLGSGGLIYYKVQVYDQAYDTYAVLLSTIDEGKTLADLEAYPKTATQAPPWVHNITENYVMPGSTTYYGIKLSAGPIYLSCFHNTESGILRILDYGPVEIK